MMRPSVLRQDASVSSKWNLLPGAHQYQESLTDDWQVQIRWQNEQRRRCYSAAIPVADEHPVQSTAHLLGNDTTFSYSSIAGSPGSYSATLVDRRCARCSDHTRDFAHHCHLLHHRHALVVSFASAVAVRTWPPQHFQPGIIVLADRSNGLREDE